ncbi:MAG: dienelactone hydrolase family protein [Acidobacteria bacterium]|nr:dienelactone hydrolase family protein [Acidobacteriota bacterium]
MERKVASDYPRELLDLFHEYQHGDIDRRTFLDRAVKFAVGGLTVAAIFEGLKPNYAWAQQVPPDDKRIKVGYEVVQSPAGNGSIKGYLARPAKGKKLPVVLVIHENRGLNPYIEDVARRLALAKFIAFAPDGLTSVGGYPGSDEKGAVAFRTVDGKKMTEDFVAAAKWLKARPDSTGKLGAVGFCFGGGIVNQLAVRLGADLNAGVAFYGRQAGVDDVPRISAPLLLHYAGNDQGINAGIANYEAALKANNKVYVLHMYEGKQHGFHNDTTPRYDETAAKLAWTRTLEFFNKYLGNTLMAPAINTVDTFDKRVP